MGFFKNHCNLHFGPPLRSNPLGELVNLEQLGTMEECQRQFQSLLARATTVCLDQQVDLFNASLVITIGMDVELQNPRNLATIMDLTRAYARTQQLEQGFKNKWGASA